jgi:predicted metal-dependent hydrolase
MFTEQERLENVANLTLMNNRIEASEKEIARAEGLLNDMKEMHNELVSLRDFYAELLTAIDTIEDEA